MEINVVPCRIPLGENSNFCTLSTKVLDSKDNKAHGADGIPAKVLKIPAFFALLHEFAVDYQQGKFLVERAEST
jgi:hypothetical protein